MAMDFFLAGDRVSRHGEGCRGLERPLARFSASTSHILSRFLNVYHRKVTRAIQAYFPAMLSCVPVTNASPTTISLPVFISLYFERFAAANAKSAYVS